MVKRNFLAGSLAFGTIICCSLPVLAQSAASADDKADLSKIKSEIEKKNYATALKELKPLAEKGSKGAQFHLALMYLEGQGVPEDPKKAAEWFQKSADQGGKHSIYNLGLLYAQGKGVKQDINKAFELFKKVADEGEADAQYN